MTRRSVLIASEDRLFADAAATYLAKGGAFDVVGVAADGVEALKIVARRQPDALLVIGDVGRMRGAAVAQQVHRRWPEIAVAVVGDHAPSPSGRTAEEVVAAMVVAGPAPTDGHPATPVAERERERLGSLTRREIRVLRLVARGASSAEIARDLGVSEHTVRTHLQNLYAKLGVHSRVEVVSFAARHALVEIESGEPFS